MMRSPDSSTWGSEAGAHPELCSVVPSSNYPSLGKSLWLGPLNPSKSLFLIS